LISIIIPCRNEEGHIKECVESLMMQKDLPDIIEILVVDGMSTDKTRFILNQLERKYNNVRMIDNPLKITPVALNNGIKNSKGQFISILGAHAEYGQYFIKNSYDILNKDPLIMCAGGPIISKGINDFAKAVALAMSSSIGVGNAKHRFPDFEGYAEMACFPMFKREIFNKIGLYDESLIRNQDDEFCFRLRLNGWKVFLSPKVISSYYVRNNPIALFRQYYEYGKWRVPVLVKHKIPISYRQQVPAAFFLINVLIIISASYFNVIFLGLLLPISYFIILVGFSILCLKKTKFSIIKYLPIILFILHFSYAAGFIHGVIKLGFNKIRVIF
jgi:succinoglycan biosynthesis protein ExoA